MRDGMRFLRYSVVLNESTTAALYTRCTEDSPEDLRTIVVMVLKTVGQIATIDSALVMQTWGPAVSLQEDHREVPDADADASCHIPKYASNTTSIPPCEAVTG